MTKNYNELGYTDNQKHDFFKFFQIVFVKDKKFRLESFSGIEIYSQFIREVFGKNYTKTIYAPLMENHGLRLVDEFYCNYSNQRKQCKTYAIDLETVEFYDWLKSEIKKEEFTGNLSKKKVNTSFNEKLIESETNMTYNIKDCRIHSSWVTVPRDARHVHIDGNGNKLLIDLDFKTAYPTMIAELLNDPKKLASYVAKRGLVDRGLVDRGLVDRGLCAIDINTTIQCSSFLKERISYQKLLNGDFYNNFRDLFGSAMERDVIKKMCNTLINSDSKTVKNFVGDYKNTYDKFSGSFPIICGIFLMINDSDTEYVGRILAREYESGIIYNIKSKIDSLYLFNCIKTYIIFDGIELRGKAISDAQINKIWDIVENE
jgi:hypothetical protein